MLCFAPITQFRIHNAEKLRIPYDLIYAVCVRIEDKRGRGY